MIIIIKRIRPVVICKKNTRDGDVLLVQKFNTERSNVYYQLLEEEQRLNNHLVENEEASWYIRHRIIDNEFNVPKSRLAWEKTKIVKCVELDDETAGAITNMFGDNENCW